MIIEDVNTRNQLTSVGIGLTRAEARELRDTLETLLGDSGERHEHVSSSDYQTELTIWITERSGTPS